MPAATARPGNAQRADYPRMLYHPDGRTKIVQDAAEHDAAAKEGWDTVPLPAHRGPKALPSPQHYIDENLLKQIRAIFEEVLDARGLTAIHDKGDEHHGQRTREKGSRSHQ